MRYHRVHEFTISDGSKVTVELSFNEESLAKEVLYKALRNKSGRTKLLDGEVVGRIIAKVGPGGAR